MPWVRTRPSNHSPGGGGGDMNPKHFLECLELYPGQGIFFGLHEVYTNIYTRTHTGLSPMNHGTSSRCQGIFSQKYSCAYSFSLTSVMTPPSPLPSSHKHTGLPPTNHGSQWKFQGSKSGKPRDLAVFGRPDPKWWRHTRDR